MILSPTCDDTIISRKRRDILVLIFFLPKIEHTFYLEGGLCAMRKIGYQKIQQFESENPDFMKNNLIKLFLEDPKNKLLYERVISNPNVENTKKIDIAFKFFYLKFRFISHISNTLFYNSINFDKRHRLLNSRFSLTLDAPVNKEDETTYLDLLINERYIDDDKDLFEKGSLKDVVVNEVVYNALNTLTENQLTILNLAYIEQLSDTEIAKKLNKSQQVISKTHKLALKKLTEYLNEHRGREHIGRNNF